MIQVVAGPQQEGRSSARAQQSGQGQQHHAVEGGQGDAHQDHGPED